MYWDELPIWETRELRKVFPGVTALDQVNVQVHPGEIHGLLGENGSGKSTLVKCLAGVHRPSSGTLLHKGKEVVMHSPMDAQRLGVATIFQEFSLVPSLSIAENIHLGRLPKQKAFPRFVQWRDLKTKTSEILERLGIALTPMVNVSDLSVAQKQMVEIAKALSLDASLFILDEPTAAIGIHEIERLHQLVRQLAAQGCAIIYISHRMDEVLELVDTITILKDGQVQARVRKDEITLKGIVRLMTGADLSEHYPKQNNGTNDVLLSVEDLASDSNVNGVSFDLRHGEVLGLAGLIGSGRTEIARAVFGVDELTRGSIDYRGKRVTDTQRRTVEEAIKDGLAMVTEDRKAYGLFMNFDGPRNTTIASLDKVQRRGVLNLAREHELFSAYVSKFGLPSHSHVESVQNLSGGNQQKVVISRWILADADLFLLDEPTRGIDVSAKVEVYNLINELTAQGKGVILISSDYEELLAMSDRIAFVNRGQIVRTDDARDLTNREFMQILFSQTADESEEKENDG